MKRLALLLVFLIPIAGTFGAAPHARSSEPSTPGRPAVEARRTDERLVIGRPKATEAAAKADLREQLRRSVDDWLVAHGVPRGWPIPDRLVDATVLHANVEKIDKDYGTLYVATDLVDFSNDRAARYTEVYRREVVARRLAVLSGVLGFVLIALGGVAGYIRADEATRGYYTTNLRLAAAAAVGGSGVLIYRILS